MEVKLIVANGKSAGREIPVAGPKFFVGRSEDCHLRPNSDLVSRHHCVMIVEEGFVAIRDFGSKNGTYVNGTRVKGEQELKTGDRIVIGPLEFEVDLSVGLGGKKKPKVENIEEAAARTVESVVDDDVDISDWLGGDDSADANPVADTRTVHAALEGTVAGAADRAVPPEDSVPEPAPDPVEKEAKSEKKARKDGPAKTPGRFQGPAKSSSASSGSAAADVLKQFFNRK